MNTKPVKIDEGEEHSMLLYRSLGTELISHDIALRLAEMVFVHVYGQDHVTARSPLVVVDRGDRWEVRSRDGVTPGERLRIVIAKATARILDLVSW
jgi:hypothetical protein